jgi:hypothetical protein
LTNKTLTMKVLGKSVEFYFTFFGKQKNLHWSVITFAKITANYDDDCAGSKFWWKQLFFLRSTTKGNFSIVFRQITSCRSKIEQTSDRFQSSSRAGASVATDWNQTACRWISWRENNNSFLVGSSPDIRQFFDI